MLNYYYADSISQFLIKSTEEIIGSITLSNQFDSSQNQNKSWEQQIPLLKKSLTGFVGTMFLEFSIPRMGKRVDCLVIIENVVFVIEFKIGEKEYLSGNIDQVWDYALDLKNFHQPSHLALLVPILVASEAKNSFIRFFETSHNDGLLRPIKSNKNELREIIDRSLTFSLDRNCVNEEEYSYFKEMIF